MQIEQFIDEMGWLIDDVDLGPLGLYEEIYDARTPCTWLVHVLRHREYRLSDTYTVLKKIGNLYKVKLLDLIKVYPIFSLNKL